MSEILRPVLQIPLLKGQAQRFSITLSNVQYQMTFTYRDAIGTGWIIDLDDADGNSILAGIPLILGINLFEPFADSRLPGGSLCALSQPQFDADPTFDGLGQDTLLYYVP